MGGILVVDDNELVSNAVARLLRSYRPVVKVADATRAIAELEANPPLGLVVDICLGDGGLTGFDVLACAGACPAAVMTAYPTAERRARAEGAGATFLPKPLDQEHIAAFLQRVFAFDYGLEPNVASVVRERSREWDLNPAHVDVLMAHVAGGGRAMYLAKRDVALATYRTQVTQLLAKANVGSRMEHVVGMILREASRVRS